MNLRFYTVIKRLKETWRQGWLGRGLKSDTLAAHIYGTTVLGWMLADKEKVDGARVVRMLLVHDFVMAKMEDVSPTIGKFSGKYGQKVSMEERAKKEVAGMLSANLKKDYLELFDEFQKNKTAESQVALEADKLETLLQGDAFEEENKRHDVLDEFLVTYLSYFKTESGKHAFDDIKKRHQKRAQSRQKDRK